MFTGSLPAEPSGAQVPIGRAEAQRRSAASFAAGYCHPIASTFALRGKLIENNNAPDL